jgi:anti-sigma factor RsiW
MNAEKQAPQEEVAEQLVAYLDGELDNEAARDVERRLKQDPEYRRRLQQYQQSWDLLDELPHTDVDESFTQSTVAMAAVQAKEEVEQVETSQRQRKRIFSTTICVATAAAFLVGFVFTRRTANRADRQLLRDLPVIEHLDEYRAADSLEFLRVLEQERLFAEEDITNDL